MKDIKKLLSRLLLFFLQVYFRWAKSSRVSYKAYINQHTRFEDHCKIGENTLVAGVKIGRGSYIGPLGNLTNAEVGRFCSIGRNVRIIDGFHPVHDWVSTHPAFFSAAKQAGFSFVKENRFEEHRFFDASNRISVKIGNDVWIGNNVSIFSGVEIGNGAVIAAGAVVTKNVDSYAIVGGVPVKNIGYRFSQDDISQIEASRWWEWPMEVLQEKADSFSDVKAFLQEIKTENRDFTGSKICL